MSLTSDLRKDLEAIGLVHDMLRNRANRAENKHEEWAYTVAANEVSRLVSEARKDLEFELNNPGQCEIPHNLGQCEDCYTGGEE